VLSACIHILIVASIVAGGDAIHPFLVVKIPSDGLLDALFELE
jgi:hypothetical protein